jgi:DNA polymerase III delta prime subunit
VSTPLLAFPQPLAEKYRPQVIADFVGLERPKKILGRFASGPYQSAWLFVGPPGVGKTSMALALAAQIGAELHHIPSQKCNAQAIDDTCRTCAYVPLAGGFHLVIVDLRRSSRRNRKSGLTDGSSRPAALTDPSRSQRVGKNAGSQTSEASARSVKLHRSDSIIPSPSGIKLRLLRRR